MWCARRDWRTAPNILPLSLSMTLPRRGSTCTGTWKPTVTLFLSCHTHARTHTHTHTIMSLGKQGEEAVMCLCAALMSFNSLVAGPGAGQSWFEAKTGSDHLWRRKKKSPGLWAKGCGRLCVCDVYVLHFALSPHFLHFSLSLSACVSTKCEILGWWKLQGTGTAVSWSALDKPLTDTIKPHSSIYGTQSSYLLPNVQHINILQNTHSMQISLVHAYWCTHTHTNRKNY